MKIKRKLFYVVLIAVALLAFTAWPVSASSGNPQVSTAPDLTTFLNWLISGPGSILAVSWLLERMKWFQAMESNAKDYLTFGIAAVVGCAALAMVTYVPASTMAAIAPYFMILSSMFVTVFVMKTFHKADKQSNISEITGPGKYATGYFTNVGHWSGPSDESEPPTEPFEKSGGDA